MDWEIRAALAKDGKEGTEDAKIPNWYLISPIPLNALVFDSDCTIA